MQYFKHIQRHILFLCSNDFCTYSRYLCLLHLLPRPFLLTLRDFNVWQNVKPSIGLMSHARIMIITIIIIFNFHITKPDSMLVPILLFCHYNTFCIWKVHICDALLYYLALVMRDVYRYSFYEVLKNVNLRSRISIFSLIPFLRMPARKLWYHRMT